MSVKFGTWNMRKIGLPRNMIGEGWTDLAQDRGIKCGEFLD
jgi:hypothetical protein